eukprot:UN25915
MCISKYGRKYHKSYWEFISGFWIEGFFTGLGATISRDVVQFATYFPIYEYMLKLIEPSRDRDDHTQIGCFISGALAGMGCWTYAYPIDVIKTHIQISPPGTYKSFWSCGAQIYKKSGVRG